MRKTVDLHFTLGSTASSGLTRLFKTPCRANEFLEKPVELSQLMDVLRRTLEVEFA